METRYKTCMSHVYKTLTDAELFEKFNHYDQQSDHYAFQEIYDRYSPPLLLLARKMTKNYDLAQDLVQDLFTYLLMKKGSLEQPRELNLYLYKALRNLTISKLRRNKLNADYINALALFANNFDGSSHTTLEAKELQETIEREILNLPPKMKAIFEMSRKEYLNHMEIAEAAGISKGTVTKQIVNAIKILRSKISIFFLLSFMVAILWFNKNIHW